MKFRKLTTPTACSASFVALLSMTISCGYAADVPYPGPLSSNDADTILIGGAAPSTVADGKIGLGGGIVRASKVLHTGYGSLASPGLTLGDSQYGFYVNSGTLYAKSGSSGQFIYTGTDNTQKVTWGNTFFIIGSDPGGDGLLRVGGNISIAADKRFTGATRYTGLAWPLELGHSGEILGDDGNYAAISINHSNRVTISTGTGGSSYSRRKIVVDSTGIVMGVDPGGAQILRIGGDANVKGQVISSRDYSSEAANPGLAANFFAAGNPNAGARSRILRVGDRAFIDYETVAGGRGVWRFGTDFSGRNDVFTVNTSASSVGVGTSTSRANLQVSGDSHMNGAVTVDGYLENLTAAQGSQGMQVRCVSNGGLIRLLPNASGSAYNPLVQAGDTALVYTKGSAESGSLVIGSHSASPKGIRIDADGNVGIGTGSPGAKLGVNGTIRAKEVRVEASSWPDTVFEKGYALPSLQEVRDHIAQHGHLPGIPSAAEVAREGIAVADMNVRHMTKIEELTLYVLQADQDMQETQARLRASEQEIQHLRNEKIQLQEERDRMRMFMDNLAKRLTTLESAVPQKVSP